MSTASGPRLVRTKMLVARALCHPWVGEAIGRFYRDRIPDHRGCTIRTPSPVTPAVKAMLFWKVYESAELRFVERYLRRDLDVVELGASIGVVGSHIAKRLASGRKLVCVEANPKLVDIVESNIRFNAPGVRLAVMNGAISYSDAHEVDFHVADTNLASAVGRGGDSVRVPVVTLGRVLREHCVESYCLVSDIEGAEADLIRQDGTALAHCRQIIIELHQTVCGGKDVSPAEMTGWLVDLGFRVQAQYGPVCVLTRD